MTRDPYNILQVARHAEPEVIEAAYKRLALKYHPDQNPGANSTAHMQNLNWAYQILKDPTKRARYDRGVRPQAPPKPKPPPAQPKPPPPKPPPVQPKPARPPPNTKPKPRPQTTRLDTEWRWWAGAAVGIPTLFILFTYFSDPNNFVRATPQPTLSVVQLQQATLEARSAVVHAHTALAPLPTPRAAWSGTITNPITMKAPIARYVSLYDNGDHRVLAHIPNGTVCNISGEASWDNEPMYEIECFELNVKGWVMVQHTE